MAGPCGPDAVGRPARRVALRQRGYHAGLGRGHVVSEAWLDDFGRWAVLDGQNGLYWADPDGRPLASLELQRAVRAGVAPPARTATGDAVAAEDAALWLPYFDSVTSDAGTWSPDPFGMVFQRDWIVTSRRLEHDPGPLYPDLSEIGVETALADGAPALRLCTSHPYARGFLVDGRRLDTDTVALDLEPGEHSALVALATPFGALRPHRLAYRVG